MFSVPFVQLQQEGGSKSPKHVSHPPISSGRKVLHFSRQIAAEKNDNHYHT